MLQVTHYRVPENETPGKEGRTEWQHVMPYSQRYGFMASNAKPAQRGGITSVDMDYIGGHIRGTASCSLSQNFEYAEGRRVAALRVIAEVMRRQGVEAEDIERLLDLVTSGPKVNY